MRTTIESRLAATPRHSSGLLSSGSLFRSIAAPSLLAICVLGSAGLPRSQAPAQPLAGHVHADAKALAPAQTQRSPPGAHSQPAAPVPVVPPPPEKPNWPAFAEPAPASVVWNGRGLSIDAANSSLQQILKDVATATGIKVDGFNTDERIFGAYGPGNAGDVLSQLLQGSGYNVLMIGDLAPGTPRQIILSARQTGISQPQPRNNQSSNQEDNEQEEQVVQEPEPPQPQTIPLEPRAGVPNGRSPRTPQEIMEEMQQRQQRMQQQQQQQPPNNQPN